MDVHRHNVLILQQMGVNQQTQDEQLTLLVMMRRRWSPAVTEVLSLLGDACFSGEGGGGGTGP